MSGLSCGVRSDILFGNSLHLDRNPHDLWAQGAPYGRRSLYRLCESRRRTVLRRGWCHYGRPHRGTKDLRGPGLAKQNHDIMICWLFIYVSIYSCIIYHSFIIYLLSFIYHILSIIHSFHYHYLPIHILVNCCSLFLCFFIQSLFIYISIHLSIHFSG